VAADIVIALLLLAANAFFVASEFSITRVRPTQAAEWLREGRPGAKSVDHAVRHIDAYLSACQLGITLASLGLGALGEKAFHELLEPAIGADTKVAGLVVASAVAFLIITVLHVVLGELSPKSLAIARTPRVVLLLAPPMRAFYLVTKPVVDLLNGMGNLVLRPFGIPPASEAGHAPHSEDELRTLLRESREGGLLGADEQRLSDAALVFGDLRAREVMLPRADIASVRTEDLSDVVATAIESGHTRLPVVPPDGGLDEALGVINVKDLLPAAAGDDVDLRDIVRPLARVHEATRVDELLRTLRGQRQHIALVVDEHGTVVGLLTLEDLLEELVGDIQDEYDPEAERLIRADGDALRIGGEAPLRMVTERLDLALDDPHEATIGGHVVEELGRVPREGEVVELHGVRFEVVAATDTQVEELRVPTPVRGTSG
jgi:CBS domain containing-hemolysin-like protein